MMSLRLMRASAPVELGTQVTDGVRSGHPAKGLDSGDAIPLEEKQGLQPRCSRNASPRPAVQGQEFWLPMSKRMQSWKILV